VSEDVTVLIRGVQHHGTLVNGFVHLGKRRTTYGYRGPDGKSIRERIWDELDDVMDLMMACGDPNPLDYSFLGHMKDDAKQFGKWQGIAEAMCYVICMFEDPTHPDIESVKGEAVLRWRRRQEEMETSYGEASQKTVLRGTLSSVPDRLGNRLDGDAAASG